MILRSAPGLGPPRSLNCGRCRCAADTAAPRWSTWQPPVATTTTRQHCGPASPTRSPEGWPEAKPEQPTTTHPTHERRLSPAPPRPPGSGGCWVLAVRRQWWRVRGTGAFHRSISRVSAEFIYLARSFAEYDAGMTPNSAYTSIQGCASAGVRCVAKRVRVTFAIRARSSPE